MLSGSPYPLYTIFPPLSALKRINWKKPIQGIDAGERDLRAHAISCNDEWVLCGPDKASLMYGICNGYRERLVSLEQILIENGFRPSIAIHYYYAKKWHEKKLAELAIEAGLFPT